MENVEQCVDEEKEKGHGDEIDVLFHGCNPAAVTEIMRSQVKARTREAMATAPGHEWMSQLPGGLFTDIKLERQREMRGLTPAEWRRRVSAHP